MDPLPGARRRNRPGRRTAIAAGLGGLVVLVVAFSLRENLAAWWVGYRFYWSPAGTVPVRGKSLNAAGRLLLTERDQESVASDGVWSIGSGQADRLVAPPGLAGVVRAMAINDRGHIVGAVEPRDGRSENRPFLWTPEAGMELLPSPGPGNTVFSDLNERGEAVGSHGMRPWSSLAHECDPAFHWTPQVGFRDLELGCWAPSISEAGWIAGASRAGAWKKQPAIWRPPDPRAQQIGLPSGFDGGEAVDLDERGTVLVNLWKVGGDYWEEAAFLWSSEGGYEELPVPAGYSRTSGLTMDQKGTVLLQAERGEGAQREARHFLIWGGELRELPWPWGAVECEFYGLSGHGWLVGRARLEGSPDAWRGFVAQPVR